MSATADDVAGRLDVMNENEGSLPQAEAACDALLAQFVLKAEGPARKLSEAIYEMLLGDVQNYLRDNATWNLANEIDRCRRIEAENRSQAARIEKLEEALGGLMDDINGLIDESEGVYGLHLNGDPSPWDELVAGGRFERLTHLPDAAAALERT